MNKLYLFLLFIIASNFYSQTLNLQSSPQNKVQFDISFDKAIYSNSYIDQGVLSGIFNFGLNLPVSQKLNIVGKIPIVHNEYEVKQSNLYGGGYAPNVNETGFGNLFVGIQTKNDHINYRRTIITTGVFLPMADSKSASGVFFNTNDIQFYINDAVGLYFNYMYERSSEEGFDYAIEFGPNIIIPIKDVGLETELLLHYGLDINYQIQNFKVNAEILGMGIISEEVDNFEDRFSHFVNFGFQWKFNNFIPKIYYRTYLEEELHDAIDGVWGFGVNLTF